MSNHTKYCKACVKERHKWSVAEWKKINPEKVVETPEKVKAKKDLLEAFKQEDQKTMPPEELVKYVRQKYGIK